ncbi:phage integrase family protein [Acinetobacter baumannii ATCC 17978]|nr:phage integrase family protein [Acinetobacter baumannii ATCC 17978]
MRVTAFHPLLWNRPQRFAEIDLAPGRIGQLALAHHRQQ